MNEVEVAVLEALLAAGEDGDGNPKALTDNEVIARTPELGPKADRYRALQDLEAQDLVMALARGEDALARPRFYWRLTNPREAERELERRGLRLREAEVSPGPRSRPSGLAERHMGGSG